MLFYHGSTTPDIKELKPFADENSNLKEVCVYLTTSRQLALHYAGNYKKLPFRSPMLNITEDKLIFQEMYPDALKLAYQGVRGYIYYCEGDYEIREIPGVKFCAVSYNSVPVSHVEYIDDIYEEIMEYQKQGKFVYEKYEELPQYRHDIIRGYVMRAIKSQKLLNNPTHFHYNIMREKFPVYWKEAEVLEKNGLL